MRPIVELDELKSIELNIMKSVHEFCVANNIQYVLSYGTLLGAIRHKGFIPWDDDIDIQMPREDYIRFEKKFPEWGKERGISVVGPHTKGNEFPRDLLKVCDDKTLLLEKSYKSGCQLGVFVDIWPLDKVPRKNSLKDKLWVKYVQLMSRIALASDIDHKSDAYNHLTFGKRAFVSLFGIFNAKKIVLKQEKISKKNIDVEDAVFISFQVGKTVYEPKDIFPAVLHIFEDTEFFIPNNYDEVLQRVYGNYMELPPIDQRKPHHIQDVYMR